MTKKNEKNHIKILTFAEAVLTSTHNLCFRAEIRKIMYTPVNSLYYIKVGFKGSTLYRHVFVMKYLIFHGVARFDLITNDSWL